MQYQISEQHQAILVPPSVIYYDESFNCRQPFTAESVLELAKEIDQTDLIFPLTAQPACDVLGGLPPGYEFRLIAGFRRFTAMTIVLKRDFVPIVVKYGLSEQEARRINYKENVDRQQLTFLEEANGLKRLYPEGTSIARISRDLHRTTGWVKARLLVLKMPERIQQDANTGRLTHYDIEKLSRMPPDGQLAALERLYAEQERQTDRKQRPVSFKSLEAKRRRSKSETEAKIVQLAGRLGDGIWCDVLRWQVGLMSAEELDKSVDEWDDLTSGGD